MGLRERSASLYGAGPYYLAKLMIALPSETFPFIIQNTILYWIMPFNHSAGSYLMFLLISCSMAFASIGIAFFLGITANGNAGLASGMVAPIALILMLTGGFFINFATIPVYVAWIKDVSYLSFAYQGLCINEFVSRTILIGDTSYDGECFAGQEAICRKGASVLSNLFSNGEDDRTADEWSSQMWMNLFYILILIVIFNLLAYLMLLTKGPKYLVRKGPEKHAIASPKGNVQ